MSTITDAASLEAVVGGRSAVGHLKSIRFLDAHSDAILARSPLSVVGALGADGNARIRTVGGAIGTVRADGETSLVLDGLDPTDLVDGAPVGALSLVPGYGETLRVNGLLRLDPTPRIEVREVFLHCAKAIIRSQLWRDGDGGPTASAGPGAPTGSATPEADLLDPAVLDVLARSRFAALFSIDGGDHFGDGGADVSPKGDPAGFIRVLDEHTVAIPDRPGNQRTDTMHNLLVTPQVAALAFVAGTDRVVELRGTATVSDEPELLATMEVDGKVPAAAIVIAVEHVELRRDVGVAAARLWNPALRVDPGDLPRGARVWTDHVRLNEDPGDEADVVRQLIEEEPMAEGLEQNYRDGLY